MKNATITGEIIISGLKKLGLNSGDTVLLHSSLASIGHVNGGAETVVDAILSLIGKKGTLLMPSFPAGGEHELLRKGLIFDIKTSNSQMGIITETFRKRKGIIRSLNPSHCVAGFGSKAQEILSGHEKCNVSVGRNTPFEKIIHLGGKILLLGVTHEVNTILHYLENTNGAPTLSRELFNPIVVDADGHTHVVPTYPHMPGLKRQYQRVEKSLIDSGIQRNGNIGNAISRIIDARGMADIISKRIQKTPMYLIEPFSP